ncbi:MAG: lactate utilization protein [Lachnospiraceae bacterium]|nr:lactate utilization protein [Lachnospiraceae bacterium]
MTFQQQAYANAAETIIKNLKKRNMEGFYCASSEDAVNMVKELIPAGSSVTWGGSESMVESGIMDAVKQGDYELIDRTAAKTPEEARTLYGKIVCADYFFTGTNAITTDGELINIDGNGNRVACLITGPANVIVIAGMNKVVANVEDGVRRIRNIATPANVLRVGVDTPCSKTGVCQDCLSPGCICNQIVVTRRSGKAGRIKVLLVGESLGF